MATTDLSHYDKDSLPSLNGAKVAIVVAEWNNEITEGLYRGCEATFKDCGITDIIRKDVPGSFELPMGAQFVLENTNVDAVVCLGSVIQGETKHFDFVCQGVTQGIVSLNFSSNRPVVFCVLTDNTLQQAIDRSGGQHGNKGVEAAVTALKMIALAQQ